MSQEIDNSQQDSISDAQKKGSAENLLLHVDCDKTTVNLLTSIFNTDNLILASITNGKEAIDRVKKEKPSLIIVGDELDDLDGIGWIIQVRKVAPRVPLVLITKSWPSPELYETLTKTLKVSFVALRPIKANIFQAQIKNLLSGEQNKPLSPEELHQKALATLTEKYRKALPERISSLKKSIELAKVDPLTDENLIEATRLSHNLKGSSGSCGFTDLSEASEHLEHALRGIAESGLQNNSAAWYEIEEFCRYVEIAAQHACNSSFADSPQNKQVEIDKPAIPAISTTPVNYSLDKSQSESEKDQEIHFDNNNDQYSNYALSTLAASHPELISGNTDFSEDEEASSIRVLVVTGEAPIDFKREADGLPVKLIYAASETDALERARTLALDAALLDIDPEAPQSGTNMARALRCLPGNENLPVAFVSTLSAQEESVEATHAGASLHLVKPLRAKMLSNAVDYLLGIRSGGRPRVLIVDDDLDFTRLVATLLSSEGNIVKALHDPRQVLPTISQFSPDIVLLDVMMPGTSGYQICRSIREHKQWHDLPILFLTGQTGLSARLAAFEAGGDDYLPKPVAPAELSMRVRVRLERSRMLKERADKDVLTGLLLRRAFMEQLDSLLSESRFNKLRYSICLLDVDHFKKVNDTYGHLAGDEVLTRLGSLLRRRFRVEDLRGRWGGEEFIIAFRHIEKATAKGALQRCLEELRCESFLGDNGEEFHVTFSAGLVSYPEDADNNNQLIKMADQCLYQAKHEGRNRIQEHVQD